MKPTMLPNALLVPLWVLVLVLSISAQAVSSSAAPRTPSGASPAEALAVTCNWEFLPPTSHVWYRWPRSDEDRLNLELVSSPENLKGMEFQVYAAQAEGGTADPILYGPVGYDQPSNSLIAREWKGTPLVGATYYVDVINRSSLYADYGLCAH